MASLSRRTLMQAALPIGLLASAGCSRTQQKSEPPRVGDAVPDTGTLRAWCWDPSFNIYAMKEAGKLYTAQHPKVSVAVTETPWDDIQTKLTTLALSNEADRLPDVFLVQNNAFQKNVTNYPELFADLTETDLAFDEYPDSVVNYSTVEGRRYGVSFDSGTVANPMRIDLLDKAGLSLDDFTDITWLEYLEKGKQVKAKVGKPLLSGMAGETDLVMMMLQSAGASLFDEQGNAQISNNDVLASVVKTYQDLVASGVMVEVNSWDQYIGSFVNGSVASALNGAWILGSVQTAKDQKGLWDITTMPRLTGFKEATNYSANGGSSWAVSAHGQTSLAVDLLKETFAGSTKLYDTVLPSSGALANWIPAGRSAVYREPQPFFNNQPVYSRIVEYSTKVPSNTTGVFYYEARDAVGAAIAKVLRGVPLAKALGEAQKNVEFAMK